MSTRAVAQPFGKETKYIDLTPQEEAFKIAAEAQNAVDVQAKKDAAVAIVAARASSVAAVKVKLALSDNEFDDLKNALSD